MKLHRQINNIKIYNLTTGGWICKAPDGRILETFAQRDRAEQWCYNTWDFTRYNKGLKMDN